MKHLAVVLLGLAVPLVAQTWKPAVSPDRQPHFEIVNGKHVFFSGGFPFTVLAVETQWEELIYGRYADTMHAYDYMYPAAAEMHLNALKVPIKWSVVEPSERDRNDLQQYGGRRVCPHVHHQGPRQVPARGRC